MAVHFLWPCPRWLPSPTFKLPGAADAWCTSGALLWQCTGVVSGSLATSLTDPQALLAGASGGVYAILLAHLPTLILNWREIDTLMEWTVHGFVLLVGLIDLVVTIITRHTSGEAITVGYSAHIAGALAGFLVGVNLIRNFRHERWEGILRVVCLLIWTIGVATTILWNSVATPFFSANRLVKIPRKRL